MQSTERWLPVVGYEGHYEVSDHGNVRRTSRSKGARVGRILKPGTTTNGHYFVNLCVDGKAKSRTIHRLVALAFLGNPGPDLEVCHGDGNAKNNHLSNLRWDTRYENYLDMVRHGTAHVDTKWSQCKRGHPFDESNTYIAPKSGRQSCRACRAAYHRNRKAALKQNRGDNRGS